MTFKVSRRAFTIGGMAALSVPHIVRAQSTEPIRIGFMQALTGPSSNAGIGFHSGAVFAVDQINAAGGVQGRPIDLLVRDTQGQPTKAVNAAQALISHDNVHAILGPGNSGEALATLPIVSRGGVPQLTGGTLDELIDVKRFPNVYRTDSNNAQRDAATRRYTLDILKLNKVAVFGDSTGYGTSAVDSSVKAFKERGADVTATSLIDPNQVDVTAEMKRAQQSGAEVIVLWTASTGFIARILNSRADIGWDVPVVGHTSLGSGQVGQLLSSPDNWKNVYPVGFLGCSFDSTGKLPPLQEKWVASLPSSIDLETLLMWEVGWGYDAVNMIADAVIRAGSDAPADLVKTLDKTVGYKGIVGTFGFTPQEHNGFPDDEVVMVVADSIRHGAFTLAPGY